MTVNEIKARIAELEAYEDAVDDVYEQGEETCWSTPLRSRYETLLKQLAEAEARAERLAPRARAECDATLTKLQDAWYNGRMSLPGAFARACLAGVELERATSAGIDAAPLRALVERWRAHDDHGCNDDPTCLHANELEAALREAGLL